MRAADRDDSVESWLLSERHYDRALALIGSASGPERRRALLGRARARIHQRHLDTAHEDVLAGLAEARAAGDRRDEARALTLLGDSEVAVGAYDLAEATFADALEIWRELGDDSGAATVLRGLGMSHTFRGELAQAERFVSEALGSYRATGDQRGAAWALQNLAWISFSHGNIPLTERRLEESADLFGELGDWGGLGWAYGLLAFVRYNQGRLDEAAAIAEHIALEGRETGNRWAVAMMDVLLANVALWTGKCAESIERGRDAFELFQQIGDRWGEVMATGSTLRALAGLGRDDEYEMYLARFYEIARQLPDSSMHGFPNVIDACVQLQRGDPDAALRALGANAAPRATEIGAIDEIAALGLAHLQQGDTDAAIATLEPVYREATDDGPRLAVGCRLALAYAAAHRVLDTEELAAELDALRGGTYSDRMLILWAQSLAHAQAGAREDARARIDAAYAIAAATDARLEQGVAALARAKVLAALAFPDAAEAEDDSRRQLAGLHLQATGWSRLFDCALAGVPAAELR
jgi:tetratricopeptide (TPR) repeat protein